MEKPQARTYPHSRFSAAASPASFGIPPISIKSPCPISRDTMNQYRSAQFQPGAPALPPVLPEWSPIGRFGGYGAPLAATPHRYIKLKMPESLFSGLWGIGCDCFAF